MSRREITTSPIDSAALEAATIRALESGHLGRAWDDLNGHERKRVLAQARVLLEAYLDLAGRVALHPVEVKAPAPATGDLFGATA
jgi:hypothetical protein